MATATIQGQMLADAGEHDAAERYRRRRQFGAVIADAVRWADTMTRLELRLALPDEG